MVFSLFGGSCSGVVPPAPVIWSIFVTGLCRNSLVLAKVDDQSCLVCAKRLLAPCCSDEKIFSEFTGVFTSSFTSSCTGA